METTEWRRSLAINEVKVNVNLEILFVFSGQQAEAGACTQCWSWPREVLLFLLAREELHSQ